MGMLEVTVKGVIAVLVIYAGALIVDTNFQIIGEWATGILRFSKQGGGMPGEVYGALMIAVVLGFLIWKN